MLPDKSIILDSILSLDKSLLRKLRRSNIVRQFLLRGFLACHVPQEMESRTELKNAALHECIGSCHSNSLFHCLSCEISCTNPRLIIEGSFVIMFNVKFVLIPVDDSNKLKQTLLGAVFSTYLFRSITLSEVNGSV